MGQVYPNPSTAKVDCSVPSTHKSREFISYGYPWARVSSPLRNTICFLSFMCTSSPQGMRSIWVDEKSWGRKQSETAVRLETKTVDPQTARQFSSPLCTVCDNDGGYRVLKQNLRVTFSVCNHAIKPICDRLFPNTLFISRSKVAGTLHNPNGLSPTATVLGTHPASTRSLNVSSTTISTQFNLQMQFLFDNILYTKANLKGFEWSHKNSTISLPIRNEMMRFRKEGFS